MILWSRLSSKDYRLQVIEWATHTIITNIILADPTMSIDQLCQVEKMYAPDHDQLLKVHNSIYLSRSGRWLAVPYVDIQSKATNVHLIDIESEKAHRILRGFQFPALNMSFSPDERAFAVVNWRLGPTYLWNVYTGEFREEIWNYQPVLFDVVSPVDTQLGIRTATTNTDKWLMLSRSDKDGRQWKNSVWAGFSPNGDRFVTKQNGPMDLSTTGEYPPGILWITASIEPLADLSGKELTNWCFSPDSVLLVTEHSDGELRVWNTRNGSLQFIIPPEENRLITDLGPDGLLLLTRSSKISNTVKMWDLTKGTGFELPMDNRPAEDLAQGWLNRQNDCILQFFHEPTAELPRFNTDGSKLITAAGVQDISCTISSHEEAKAWVQANIAMRWDEGQLRSASDDEMLNARIRYSTLMNGPQDPCTLSLRFELVNRKYLQLMSTGELDEALKVVQNTQTWITPSYAGLYKRMQQIRKILSMEYLKRGEISERRGKHQSALTRYENSVQTDEANDEAWRRLAWLQVTSPVLPGLRAYEAVVNAKKACMLTEWKDPHCVAVLAAAYAEVGNFKEAIQYQERALDLLSDQELPRWQANFEKRLNLYRTDRRYNSSSFWDVPTDYLVAWWKLDEQEGNVAVDSSGNANHGTLMNDATWKSGIIGGGLFLEWRGPIDEFQYVLCGNSPTFNITDAITISGWMKVDRFIERIEPLISKGDNSWALRKSSGDKMRIQLALLDEVWSEEFRSVIVRGRTGVEDGRWHHIVGVYDGEKANLYVDGILDRAIPASGSIRTNDFEVMIGQSSENSLHRQWNGLIDDVRVYKRALSSEDVKELFYLKDGSQNGAPNVRTFGPLCLTYPENISQVEATVIDDGQPYGQDSLTLDWSLLSGPGPVRFLPSSKIEDPCIVFQKPGAYELLLTASDGEKTATDVLRVAVYPANFDGLLAHYTFDDGTAVNSSSIDGLHGKLVGNAAIVQDSVRGSVLSLIDNSYVDCGSDARFDSIHELTVTAWIKVDAFAKRGQTFISKQKSWHISRYRTTDWVDFVCIGVFVPRPQWDNITSKSLVVHGNWHHIAGVFDGREMCIYVDGILDNSIAADQSVINITEEPVRIGDSTVQSGDSSNILIDDVRIYNRSLIPDEICEIYDATK